MRQIETHLLQSHYDGFLRKGRIRGRFDRIQSSGGQVASSSTVVLLWAVIAILTLIGITYFVMKTKG
jgi:preprotein translocase subunit SecY